MNPQVQISNSENSQLSHISAHYNLQGNSVSSHEGQESSTAPNDVTYVAQSHNLVPSFQVQQTVIDSHVQTTTANIQIQPVHPTVFFYRPPNDIYHYYVNCKEIPNDNVAYLLNKSLKERNIQPNENECIFYYQQYNNRLYQVTCEIVPPFLVNNCLSKTFLGVELQQNMEQEHLTLTFDQKEYLERHLKKYLSQYLLN